MRREDELLIDGSLLDNLPLEPMSASGEGPVLAIDIKGDGQARRRAGRRSADGRRARRAARGCPRCRRRWRASRF